MQSKTRRRHRQGDESRQRLLEAALDVVVERGYAGTSIGAITKRAGLPASSLYWSFESKDHLVVQALEHGYRQWRSAAAQWSLPVEDLDRRTELQERMRRSAVALIEHSEFWRLGFMLTLERRLVEPAARRRFVAIRSVVQNELADWWHEALGPGVDAQPDLPDRLARYQMGLLEAAQLEFQVEGAMPQEALFAVVAGALETFAVRHLARAS
jgi:AcrR family transcriptional regulator